MRIKIDINQNHLMTSSETICPRSARTIPGYITNLAILNDDYAFEIIKMHGLIFHQECPSVHLSPLLLFSCVFVSSLSTHVLVCSL